MRSIIQKLIIVCVLMSVFSCKQDDGQLHLETDYVSLAIDTTGYIKSIKSKVDGQEYLSSKKPSPLLSLYIGNDVPIYPSSANLREGTIVLNYPNGAVATVGAEEKGEYVMLRLLSLENRGEVDNVVWGPYNTTIREYIGDMLGVVSNEDYTIGLFAGNDNTITGVPTDGDLNRMYYYVHTTDPVKYPLPDSLSEGQKFRIGGDGRNDVAFTDKAEDYFYFCSGNGAGYDPEYGSYIVMHSRDRRKPQTIFFTLIPGFDNINVPKHHDVETIDVDLIDSSVAFFGCPRKSTLNLLETIVKNEGLPYITQGGKWVRDPEAGCADLAWWGAHDSLISYASQLGVQAVQDEGIGEYYANPADRWAGKKVSYGGKQLSITEFTEMTNKNGVAYGLHTLCEFLQPHCSDVSPIPNDSLCLVLRTQITRDISETQTDICVADTSWLNERGTWHCNALNVLKLGKELLTYEGVTTTVPYILTGVKRGAYNTIPQVHKAGEMLGKLQMNCYNGFVPDMNLQDDYADYYARLLMDGGMNYVDFDGQESFMYQGHGFYSAKRFYHRLFDNYRRYGGKELRVMGSGVMYGNWLYMANCNVGGGNNMFNPVTNKWGIQGKDVRNVNVNNFLAPSFGIQNFNPEWTVQVIENLQSKAIAWDATYMLGLSEAAVEKCPWKQELFKAFRIWEDARKANIFPESLKKEMRKEENIYHLERTDEKTWQMYKMDASGMFVEPIVLESE